jgi:hypothetical protein
VAPTGIDPVTFRFSVVRRLIMVIVFHSQTLELLGLLVELSNINLICFSGFVGKMWAK